MSWGKLCVAAVLGLLMVGCSSAPRMQSYEVVVSLAEGMNPAGTVEVDLVGVDASRKAQIQAAGDRYASSTVREDIKDKRTLYLSSSERTATLTRDDDLWKTWLVDRKQWAKELMVITDLPVGRDGVSSLTLPLASSRWKTRRIEIEVNRSGLVVLTPMEPEKE